MDKAFQDRTIAEITALLGDYFDGLYNGDVALFAKIFHENAHLYSSDGQTVTDLPLSGYLEMISNRASPQSQGLKRFDRIISIDKSGPDTAFATVNCAIPPRYFTDYLTLLRTGAGWQIISKTYHTDSHD